MSRPLKLSILLCERARGSAIVEPEYVEVAVPLIGEAMLSELMLPGRLLDGVSLSGGRSVGGLGAGPGFMNCPGA